MSKVTGFIRKWMLALRPRKKIYVLGHMRANTSLLGHILGSNPAIEGYYEMQISYRTHLDVLSAKLRYYSMHKPKAGAIYIFDKLLNNKLQLSKKVVSSGDKIIFIIRKPAPTVKSITKLFSDRPNHSWSSQSGAERYYYERLKQLQAAAIEFSGSFFCVRAEDLIDNTSSLLSELTTYLELETPLTDNYELFEQTGKRSAGDSSENIKAGKVVKKSGDQTSDVTVAPELNDLYDETLSLLVKHQVRFK